MQWRRVSFVSGNPLSSGEIARSHWQVTDVNVNKIGKLKVIFLMYLSSVYSKTILSPAESRERRYIIVVIGAVTTTFYVRSILYVCE